MYNHFSNYIHTITYILRGARAPCPPVVLVSFCAPGWVFALQYLNSKVRRWIGAAVQICSPWAHDMRSPASLHELVVYHFEHQHYSSEFGSIMFYPGTSTWDGTRRNSWFIWKQRGKLLRFWKQTRKGISICPLALEPPFLLKLLRTWNGNSWEFRPSRTLNVLQHSVLKSASTDIVAPIDQGISPSSQANHCRTIYKCSKAADQKVCCAVPHTSVWVAMNVLPRRVLGAYFVAEGTGEGAEAAKNVKT